jgi:hypothetical protein
MYCNGLYVQYGLFVQLLVPYTTLSVCVRYQDSYVDAPQMGVHIPFSPALLMMGLCHTEWWEICYCTGLSVKRR